MTQFVAADQFKSYDELEKRLNYVLGAKQQVKIDSEVMDEEYRGEEEEQSFTPNFKSTSLSKIESVDEDEDDALSYFQRLAEE